MKHAVLHIFWIWFGLTTSVIGLSFTQVQRLADGRISLGWEGKAAEGYQIEAADSLQGPYLGVSGRLAGANGNYVIDPEPERRSRFYRISLLDPDAAAYVERASILDPAAIGALSRWESGLKALGLYEHVVYMTPLQRDYNVGSGSIVQALKGPAGRIEGNHLGVPQWGRDGLEFAANGWVSLPNPFTSGFLPEFSLLAVFDSDQTSTRLIFGSESRLQGPSLLAGGSGSQGLAAKELFFDYSEDGVTAPLNYGHGGRRTFVGGNTGDPQMAMATFSHAEVTCQANMDLRFSDLGVFPPAWNGHPTWRIGGRLDGFFPFVGTVSFVAAFDRALSDAEYDQVRQLYRATLGSDLALPKVNAMIEGDSLSEESLITTWGEELFTQPNWKGKFNKRNVSHGGDGIVQMLNQFDAEVLPYATQPGRNYLFIWGGAREIDHRPAEVAFADLQRYWSMARAIGYKVITFTILPQGEPPPAVPARRLRLNELIRGAADQYDYLIDVASHPLLQDPFNETYYLIDRVHLHREANTLIAEMINRIIPNP